jgi:hypothetical protein
MLRGCRRISGISLRESGTNDYPATGFPISLALMVASYLIAMGMGVLLLGYLTAPVQRHASIATAISR